MRAQSFKRKPGRANNERSLGDASERVHKRLRTVESVQQREQEHTSNDTQQESDMYEHIRQGEEKYDTQAYGELRVYKHQRYFVFNGLNFIRYLSPLSAPELVSTFVVFQKHFLIFCVFVSRHSKH